MKCSSCNADNPAENRFCEQCGAVLAARCPKCGASLRPGAKFCGSCGHRVASHEVPTPSTATASAVPVQSEATIDTGVARALSTPTHLAEKILAGRSAMEGERRQVTVLFGDIAGFTAMSEKMDPEDVRKIVAGCFELITAEIHRFEGTINQYGGDGFMALFGAPIAHEDSTRRAVHAALEIQRALREYARQLERERGLRPQMRIGINTGLVVVGRIGDDLRMEYTAIGDTINLASRLQTAARPGSVFISEATFKAIAGFFEALDLGDLEVKGHAPVHTFEVLRERGRRAALDAAAEHGLTPLVGRTRELATLEELFAQAKAGHGQVAFVAGDAGIGKSRLVYEFRRRLAARNENVTWLEGRCVSFGQAIPMLPVIDQLRENFGIEEIDGEPEIIAKVEHGMRRIGGLESETPYLRYLLSVDPGDSAIAAMDASARRTRLFNALRALALRGAQNRPLVSVIEDLHWADGSTQDYLEFFMDSVATAPIMLIITHRVGYKPPFGGRSFHTTLNLHHLSDDEALEMASRVLGTADFPAELRTALMQKAEGVPLFVEEVTKTLIDLGFLVRENGRYRMVKTLDEASVPDTVQGIIMARLDRLGEDGKRTVQLASVIGRQFLGRLLERVAGLSGKLEGLLRELKALEIIYEQGLLPEPAYIFKHAVIQDVAYNSLLRDRRKELHRAVGEAIEELYGDRLAEHHAELAYHFMRGEDWAKAMQYGRLAGDQAGHAFANAEAAQHYARAIEAASKLPLAEPGETADLHAKRGAILTVVGPLHDALSEYEKALEISRAAKDRRRECRALLGLAEVHHAAHRLQPLLKNFEQASAIARDLGDEALQALCAARLLFPLANSRGPTDEVIAKCEDAGRLAQAVADPHLIATVKVNLGGALHWRGEFDRAVGEVQGGIELARNLHSGFLLGAGFFWSGLIHLSRGEYEATLDVFRQWSDYAQASGDRFWLARIPNCIGGVHLELFDYDEALRLSLEGEEAGRRFSPWPEPIAHSLLKAGIVHFERGDYGRADEFYKQAWELLEKDEFTRFRWHIPLVRARGELALAAGRLDEAWTFATQSRDLAEKFVCRKHIARADWLRGEILAKSGKLQDAARAFDASASLAEKLKTPRELWFARAALGRVLAQLRRDKEAESNFVKALSAIETIASNVTVPRLRRSFLDAEPVRDVYKVLGRRTPDVA
jgi:class 3 adenylate cyclase/tetratricopeptide (TPR) repeat protein